MEPQARRVARVIEPQPVVEGAGVRLRRSIGGWSLDYLDPFLLLDHFESDDPDDYLAGFPLHPHRGIETVTYMLAGEVDHKDTIGNAGTIGPGDVQWMTAGGGIMHEEMPRPREGRMGGFQLWVNMPAARKMSRPRYQEVAAADIPVVERPDGTRVRLVAGHSTECGARSPRSMPIPSTWTSLWPPAPTSCSRSRAVTPPLPTSFAAKASSVWPATWATAASSTVRW